MPEQSRPNSTTGNDLPSFTSTYNNAKETYNNAKETYRASDKSESAQDTLTAAVLVWLEEKEERKKIGKETRWDQKTDAEKRLSQARSQLASTIAAQQSEA